MSEDFAALAREVCAHTDLYHREFAGRNWECPQCSRVTKLLSRVVQERELQWQRDTADIANAVASQAQATFDELARAQGEVVLLRQLSIKAAEKANDYMAERDRLRAAVEELRDRAESAFGSQDAARLHQDVYFMLEVAERALAAPARREE